ncbi:MAG TPA: hypothetical protein VES67_02985 [Vicinamibacterales bacterium]|nr:hypothetical protein [Vicinamibacterales bacterium]
MAKQSLIWTAMPNGYSADGASLRVSVLLSPRLDAENDPQELSSFFPDWADWPATLAGATMTVRCGSASVAVPIAQTSGPNRLDTSLGGPDTSTWKALFNGGLFVEGFVFRDMSNHPVLSYDTTGAVNLVKHLYGNLAGSATDAMPKVSDLVDSNDWGDVVSAVSALDRMFVDEKTGLRRPAAQFEAFLSKDQSADNTTVELLGRMQLFHTPPSTPKVATHVRQDDPRIKARWLEYQQTPLPAKSELAKTLDFHQIVAAMNSYPTILRRLGLVVDLLIDRAAFPQAANQLLSASVKFGGPGLKVLTTADASPRTRVTLTNTVFGAVPNPSPGLDDLRLKNRLLDLDPKQFELLNVDADSAGLKLMNFARSLGRMHPDDQRIDTVTRFEKEVGAPSLRNAGLMLVQRKRASNLKHRFLASKAKDDAAQAVFANVPGAAGPILWAEDLVRGFRIDIWDRTTGRWRSLCAREATYDLGEGQVVVNVPEEETTLRLATTKSSDPASNQHVVYLHESLVSWTGWSLGAPLPGRAVLPDDTFDATSGQTDAEIPPGLHFKSSFDAVKGSLPRLRFGREYWIRARAVDLAGNSLPQNEQDFGPEAPGQHARPYLRFEPVAAPATALVRPANGTTERPAEGESMERLAIRTFNDVLDDPAATTQVARRYLVPIQASVRDAEHHGKLDAAGKVDASLFNLLANQKDRDASDPAAALQQELLPMQGPLDPAPVDTVFAVYRDGQALTYLPDPLAEEAAIRVFDHPNIAAATSITIPLYPTGKWPDAQPFKVRVFEHPTATPEYKESERTLHVPLPKAVRARVRVSMKLSKAARGRMGLWHWMTVAQQQNLDALVLDGQHWMFSPWRVLDVVHAVQRPLIAPKMSKFQLQRGFADTSVRPNFLTTCSLKSTDHLDLHAEWHEPLDEPSESASATALIDRSRGDVAFAVKITDPKRYALKMQGEPRGGFAEHTIAGDDLIGVGIVSHELVMPKHHEFHDTRYRRIEYWLEGTTAFREYMRPDLLTDANGDPTEEKIKVDGPKLVAWVPSSAPPPAPEVLYVVPTFGWVRTVDGQGRMSSWRRGGGLRVYLNRPWHSTGYGEMLAVVLPPASFAGDPNKQPQGNPYKAFVTQWGNDPLWLSPFVPGLAPQRGNFPLARTAADPAGGWIPAGAPGTEADQAPGPFKVTGLVPPGVPTSGANAGPVEIAPHDVASDAVRRLWYCDIEINQGASYWPFIRLALARYQPTSVTGAHLSPVVLADFMPLTADRWLSVSQTNDPRRRHVSVSGFRFSDSSGHQEAESSVSMSLVNPLTHTHETLTPADVSPTTVVEIWVEQLNLAHGEDFGWERVPGAPGGPHVIHAGVVFQPEIAELAQVHDVVRAKEFVAARRFADVASTGLVDAVLGFTRMWDGDVVLPSAPGAGIRYRLVIAEYEEYLVDDSRPYDPVPTKKGRRLVFVEHVEIS